MELAQHNVSEGKKSWGGGSSFAAGVRGRKVTNPADGVSIENLEKPQIELAQLPCQLGKINGGRSWWAKSGWWVREIGQRLQKAVVRRLIIGRPQSRQQSPSIGTSSDVPFQQCAGSDAGNEHSCSRPSTIPKTTAFLRRELWLKSKPTRVNTVVARKSFREVDGMKKWPGIVIKIKPMIKDGKSQPKEGKRVTADSAALRSGEGKTHRPKKKGKSREMVSDVVGMR
ncbi:hypothetical protein PCH_Pc21g05340 [Penicillium rubens Wisconsin 54-1255]|uniref:Uncharacterized protein n=1 Tax=Penicillium rubens (strain ATCC 28089 / DSM 1075 / NRRL 1951 / Wisconsin 54-1255) TaxID=500485 RepID=B6HHI0_PENRW|nr:hypothetical protein PCH_Pc21g05340 [Penicillium rubens Wisconsin 54-1255]